MHRYIPALDGLRGLAVLAVIAFHVHLHYGQYLDGRVNGPLTMVLSCGWAGVDLFFVLSGFLITGILYDTKGGQWYFRTFYARRTLRILPLYYAFLLAAFVLGRLGCSFFTWTDRNEALSLLLYVYNFRAAWNEQFHSVYNHVWSLAVEEHFYLLWPLAVWALCSRALMRLCLAGAAASFLLRVLVIQSGMWPTTAYIVTPCRLDGLLAGAFVALAWREAAVWESLQRWAGSAAAGAGGLLLGIVLSHRGFDGNLELTVGIAALAVFFAALLVLTVNAAKGSWLRRFCENKGLRAVGKYSYGIYIFHPAILLAGGELLRPLSRAPAYVSKPLGVLWLLAASFAAAWLSYHLYEKHFLRLKRFFEYRTPAPAGTPAPSLNQSDSDAQPDLLQAAGSAVPRPVPGSAQ